ncbi:MAG: AhpC/TSA family protein [Bacteroidales bacterium]|jgi:peroxiredoxin|nr:AhpC/TSA family protein [Bacteroidales bacterium]
MKRFISILSIVCVLYACSEHSGYTIQGTIQNAENDTVYLKQYQDFNWKTIDSAVVKSGKFTLQGTVDGPDYTLLYIGHTGPVQFFIENSKIGIVADKDSLTAAKITGSAENDLFSAFDRRITEFEKQSEKLNDEYNYLRLTSEGDTAKEHPLLRSMNRLIKERTQYMSDFVRQNPSSITSAFVIDNILSHFVGIEELGDIIDAFDDAHSSQWVKMMKEKLFAARKTGIGQVFSDMEMQTPDDQPVKLSDYAGKGKYVLIDFWASWRHPCRLAGPEKVELYNKYKNKGFEIIGVSFDKDKEEWTQAISDDELPWIHMSDLAFWESKAVALYSVYSIPYAILLDPEGTIIEKYLPPDLDELDDKLAELLK